MEFFADVFWLAIAGIAIYWFFGRKEKRDRIAILEEDMAALKNRLNDLTTYVARLADAQVKVVEKPLTHTAAPEAPVASGAANPVANAATTAIPPASPLPPASSLPHAPAIPKSSVPLSSPAAGDDMLWEDENPAKARHATATAPTASVTAPAGYTPKHPAFTKEQSDQGFEFQFGKKLPVWIGGIALALAGFYLVKYTIEKGLLTQEVRIFLGTAFGFALALAGRYIRVSKPDMADGKRIAQALTGAAIADLYATSYAAVSVWHVVSPAAGFVCLALVTVFAVILSLRHGMPIAILGLAGGFLTPVMVTTDHPSAVSLFIYLYFLIAGFFALVRNQGWWVLAIPVTLLGFFWVPVWIFGGHFAADDGICLGLFILAVSATIAAQAREREGQDAEAATATNNTGKVAGVVGIGMMAFVMQQSDFGLPQWAMYALLGLGGMVMAYFRPAQYKNIPQLSLGVTLLMLALWQHHTPAAFAGMLLAFTAIYVGGALAFYSLTRSFYWAGMLSAAALAFYGLGYAVLRTDVYGLTNTSAADGLHLWGALATIIALCFAALTGGVYRSFTGDEKLKDKLLALFCLVSTGFVSIALLIEVHQQFMPIAFAAETLAACWIYNRLGIPALRRIIGLLLAAVGFFMVPQLMLLGAVALNSLFGEALNHNFDMPALITQPMLHLGVPLALLGYGSYLVRQRADGKIAEALETAVVAFGALLAYYTARRLFNVPEDVLFRKAGFFERGVITNVFFAGGMLAVYAGRHYARRAFVTAGTVVFCMALFRVFFFDVLTQNPLWSGQPVGDAPLINSLLLAYGAPLFWLWLEAKPPLRVLAPVPGLKAGAAFILVFLLVNLNVRQLFHGSDLHAGSASNAETYSYSAAWLLLGLVMLVAGTVEKSKQMRIAALILTTAAVGKVFLYDARELEGLFRVFSFMGLGICMMGLSWFYTRFVVIEKDTGNGSETK
ncbi:MAG: DUF2339 domain-containing protein [Micavibrio sp.]|nr:DUF2339 domain-containing protein [Micavibrio sp.]